MTFDSGTFSRAAFKRMYGLAHTSNQLDPANESLPSTIQLAGQNILAPRASIPATASAAVSAGIALFIVCKLEQIPGNANAYRAKINGSAASSVLSGKINRLTGLTYVDNDVVGNFIPLNYGSTYRAVIRDNGTAVSPLDSRDFFFDYGSGILFSEDALNLSTTGTVEGFVYISEFLSDSILRLQWDVSGNDTFNTNSGNVGIGTQSPAGKLTVSANGTASLPSFRLGSVGNQGLFVPASGSLGLSAGGSLGATIQAGRLGINTATPQAALDIGSAGSSTAPALIFQSDPDTGIFHPAADTMSVSTAGVERITVSSTGKIGLGQSTPGHTLDVANAQITSSSRLGNFVGTFTDTAATSAVSVALTPTTVPAAAFSAVEIVSDSSGTGSSSVVGRAALVQNRFRSTSVVTNVGSATATIGLEAQASPATAVSGDTIALLSSADSGQKNIGVLGRAVSAIGSPTHNIGLLGAAALGSSGTMGVYAAIGTGASAITFPSSVQAALVANNNTSTSAILYGLDAGQVVFSVIDGGNVGVGIAVPTDRLHILKQASASGSTATVENTSGTSGSFSGLALKTFASGVTSNTGFVKMFSASSVAPHMTLSVPDASSYLSFETVGVERVRIQADGRIGIGTTTASASLDLESGSTALADNSIVLKATNAVTDSAVGLTFQQVGPATPTGARWTTGIPANTNLAWSYNTTGALTAGTHHMLLGVENTTGLRPYLELFGNDTDNSTLAYDILRLRRHVADKQNNHELGITFRIDDDDNNTTDVMSRISCLVPLASTADQEKSAGLVFYTNAANVLAERMRISPQGAVGIGNNNPVARLDVLGSATTLMSIISSDTAGGLVLSSDIVAAADPFGEPLRAGSGQQGYWGGASKVIEFFDDFFHIDFTNNPYWQTNSNGAAGGSGVAQSIAQNGNSVAGVVRILVTNTGNYSMTTGQYFRVDAQTVYFETNIRLTSLATVSASSFGCGVCELGSPNSSSPGTSSATVGFRHDSTNTKWIFTWKGTNFATNTTVVNNKWIRLGFMLSTVSGQTTPTVFVDGAQVSWASTAPAASAAITLSVNPFLEVKGSSLPVAYIDYVLLRIQAGDATNGLKRNN